MIAWDTLLLFVTTLLLMGFFAGIEMAFYSANRLSLEIKRKKQERASKMVRAFFETPDRFLGTTQLGFTLFLVLLSLQLSDVMQLFWQRFQFGTDLFRLLVEIVLATLIVMIGGEFFPRALFRAHSTALLLRFAPVIQLFYRLFYPLATGLMDAAEWVLVYLFNLRLNPQKGSLHRADLKKLFEGVEEERKERSAQLMENAQELPKVRVRQCLVPRKEVIGIDSRSSVTQLRQTFIETKLSKLIVYDGNIDRIIGYVHQLDLFAQPQQIADILHPIPAVPESMSASDLIGKFSRERKSIAWVVDEFGGTAGIVTMEDVLEELFGEIQDEYDTEEFLERKLENGDFILSGRLELDYLQEKYGLEFPGEEAETLSGYIINHHETIPTQKERIIIADYEFEILHVSDTRIETVRLHRLQR
ncbi:MAG: hemolysin family protein [Bacteroidota bacterium]|jgi:putative hemolysin